MQPDAITMRQNTAEHQHSRQQVVVLARQGQRSWGRGVRLLLCVVQCCEGWTQLYTWKLGNKLSVLGWLL